MGFYSPEVTADKACVAVNSAAQGRIGWSGTKDSI
jgi:hypothetical protein